MKVLVLCLLLVTPAFAQTDGKKIEKWTPVAQSNNDIVTMYFAPESIRRNEDRISGWTRFDFHSGSSTLLPNTNWGSIRIFAVVNCDTGTAKSYEILFYDTAGRFKKKDQDNDTAKEQKGTLGWVLFEYLCERRTSFPTGPPVLKPKT